MITGRELDAEKARKYVELLLCASGEAVLAGEAAHAGRIYERNWDQMGRAGDMAKMPDEFFMGCSADGLECISAFGGLAMIDDEPVLRALKAKPAALAGLCVWLAHTERICMEEDLDDSDDEYDAELGAEWDEYNEWNAFQEQVDLKNPTAVAAAPAHMLSPRQATPEYGVVLASAMKVLEKVSRDRATAEMLCRCPQVVRCLAAQSPPANRCPAARAADGAAMCSSRAAWRG